MSIMLLKLCRLIGKRLTNTEQRPTIRGGNVAATVASPLNSRKNLEVLNTMKVIDRNGKAQKINKGDKIIITFYDSQNKPITTMNSKAYEPHEVIEQNGQLGVMWGNVRMFTPLSTFWATFEKVKE